MEKEKTREVYEAPVIVMIEVKPEQGVQMSSPPDPGRGGPGDDDPPTF